jgi:hypothetical protein
MKRFYSVKELAEAAGYSPGTIQHRIASGQIFAIQGAERGAYRIPASSYFAYLHVLGLAPAPAIEVLPPTNFESSTPDQIYAQEVAPVLAAAGFPDMPTLLRAAGDDPTLIIRYRDAIHVYSTFLSRKAEELAAREAVLV